MKISQIIKKVENNSSSYIPKFILIIVFIFLLSSTFAFAQSGNSGTPTNNNSGTPINMNSGTGVNNNSGTPPAPGLYTNTGIKNPLGSNIPDIPSFIRVIIDFVLLIGVPIVALALIYSGFLFVTSLGNSEKLTKAKKTFIYTLIGAAILLGAFVIANAIKGTVDCIANNDTTCK